MIDETNRVSAEVPIALRQLIVANNEILKTLQAQLWEQVQTANAEMMQILRLDPTQGWKLDVEQMKYVRMSSEKQMIDAPVI